MQNENKRISFKTDKFTVFMYSLAAAMFALQCLIMLWGLSL